MACLNRKSISTHKFGEIHQKWRNAVNLGKNEIFCVWQEEKCKQTDHLLCEKQDMWNPSRHQLHFSQSKQEMTKFRPLSSNSSYIYVYVYTYICVYIYLNYQQQTSTIKSSSMLLKVIFFQMWTGGKKGCSHSTILQTVIFLKLKDIAKWKNNTHIVIGVHPLIIFFFSI